MEAGTGPPGVPGKHEHGVSHCLVLWRLQEALFFWFLMVWNQMNAKARIFVGPFGTAELLFQDNNGRPPERQTLFVWD